MQIKRYHLDTTVRESPFGAYVAIDDHLEAMDQAAKKILELEQQLKERQ
jgi:hypothetical protein